MISKPSPYACSMPYSMPLCTILTKCPAPCRAHVAVAILWGQRLEDRLAVLEDLALAADHQAVALFQAPDAAAGAAVHVVQPAGADLLRAADRVVEVGVAAVDDDVARLEQRHHVVQRVVGHLAGRHHHPDDAWRLLQLRHHVFDGVGWDGARSPPPRPPARGCDSRRRHDARRAPAAPPCCRPCGPVRRYPVPCWSPASRSSDPSRSSLVGRPRVRLPVSARRIYSIMPVVSLEAFVFLLRQYSLIATVGRLRAPAAPRSAQRRGLRQARCE